MALSVKERQQRLRETRKRLGKQRAEFWLTPGQIVKVKKFIKEMENEN
jgi:hypothetical protein